MNLGMALEVVLPNEALVAVIATELAVTEMGLNVAANVLAAAKGLVALWIQTGPAMGERILRRDV